MSNLDGPPYYDSGLGDVAVPAAVAPLGTPPDGSFPSMRTSCIIGAPKLLSDITSRDAVPSGLRAEGMIAYVQSTGLTYQLQGGITNTDWVTFGGGAGTLAATLALGNTTGGTSILVTSGDAIRGNPGATGASLTVAGGASSGTAAGGGLALNGGVPTEGAGGSITLTAADGVTATATSRAGGSITLTPGTGVSGGATGTIQCAGVVDVGASRIQGGATIGAPDVGLVRTSASTWAVNSGSGTSATGDLIAQETRASNAMRVSTNAATSAEFWIAAAYGTRVRQGLQFGFGTAASANGTPTSSYAGGSTPLTDAVATSVVTVPVASSAMVGGVIHYTITATDSTDFQALSGQVAFSAVNKSGTITSGVDNTLAQQSLVVSTASTLTVSWTTSNGASTVAIQANADSSLSGATLTIKFSVHFFSDNATISSIP